MLLDCVLLQVVDILIYKGREELEVSKSFSKLKISKCLLKCCSALNEAVLHADGSSSTQTATSSGKLALELSRTLVLMCLMSCLGRSRALIMQMPDHFWVFMQVNDYISVPAEKKLDAARAAAISPFMDRFYRNMDAYGRG